MAKKTAAKTPASASLLVELLTEELPPKALYTLGQAFASHIHTTLLERGLIDDTVMHDGTDYLKIFATPRRLAVLMTNVAAQAANKPVSQKLMPVSIGLDASGKPTAALLKKLGAFGLYDLEVLPESVKRKVDGKTEMLFYDTVARGVTLSTALQTALTEAIANLPVPKKMRYQIPKQIVQFTNSSGATGQWTNNDGKLGDFFIDTVEFVRPVHGLVALHGNKVVEVFALGLKADRLTHGHRFQGVKDITLATADAYEKALASQGKVIASLDERRAEIERQLASHAQKLQSRFSSEPQWLSPQEEFSGLPELDALIAEVTALVEYPTVYLGDFEPEFLTLPQECLILTMRQNQKYFPLFDQSGKLTNKFLIVSNMRLNDPKNIIEGNQRVVRARLADARFFFEADRRIKLTDRVPQLGKIVYHNKLGSQLDRVERVRKLAMPITDLIGADPKLTDRAALLAKADLVTSMVGEFPDLQGTMGRYYALADGEDARVANAIEQHYRPRFAGDALPENNIAIALALSDKLETLAGMFGIDQRPTGDKDPYALRRHAFGVVRILIEKKLDVGILRLVDSAISVMPEHAKSDWLPIVEFILDRARSYFSEQGYASTAIEAVLQPFGSVSWLHTLPEIVAEASRFIGTEDGRILAEANKRITNILKKSGYEVPFGLSPDDLKEKPKSELFRDKAEIVFWDALQKIGVESLELKKKQRFAESLRVLSQLGMPTKSFFDDVMVNTEEPDIRNNRITLLQHARAYMNQVADLSLMAS